ncbi:MAG TPA: hypothetical protein VIY73_17350 [Polyangiaceae bacterium]
MRIARGAWVGAVLIAAAAACSHAVDGGFDGMGDEGGAPHYEAGSPDGTASGEDAGNDASHGSGNGDGGAAAADGGTSNEEGGGASTEGGGSTAEGGTATDDAGEGTTDGDTDGAASSEAGTGEDAATDAGAGPGSDGGDDAGGGHGGDAGGAKDAGGGDAAGDAAGEDAGGSGGDAAAEAETDAGGPDASADAPHDAGHDAPSVVAPVCDGVIGATEYGGPGNQAASSSGQTWYMTWDATNLYVAVANANVDEGSILYLAVNPTATNHPAGGTTSGELYDSTDVTTLPFLAQLAVYAHDGYTEARTGATGGWGPADTTDVRLCDQGTANTREVVVPWVLVGGLPASFGWTGYLAADGNANPSGYIYGQMPTDDPSGSPANDDDFTKYFLVADATPGLLSPFADEP